MPVVPTIPVTKLGLIGGQDLGALSDLVREHQRTAVEMIRTFDWDAMRQAHARTIGMLTELNEPARQIQAAVAAGGVRLTETLNKTADVARALEGSGFMRMREQLNLVADASHRVQSQMADTIMATVGAAGLLKTVHADWSRTARAIAEQIQWAERSVDREVAKLLLKYDWLGVEQHLSTWELGRLLQIKGRGKRAAIDRAICAAFRRRRDAKLRAMVESWWSDPYLKARRPTIRQAVRAHRNKQYAVSIPALLPLADGLAAEIIKRRPALVKATAKRGRASLIKVGDVIEFHDPGGRATGWTDVAVAVVKSKVYKGYDFDTDKSPSPWNRHGVLHGRIANYASEANSLRALLLVDIMMRISASFP